jgi:methylenetetrahydrofolate--tRNA-(uracil-5-)-methyltransferase
MPIVKTKAVCVVGAGLAGSEAAWQLLRQGIAVKLFEMRPLKTTGAHKTGDFAELVCSNTLKSLDESSAPGLLKKEMLALDSLVIQAALKAQVPAGNALGVDRQLFSNFIKDALSRHEAFELCNQEVQSIDDFDEDQDVIFATGPLTSDALSQSMADIVGQKLYFYDAISPIIDDESIDKTQCFLANRYDETSDDYLNIPLSKEEYLELVHDIAEADKVTAHEFEKPLFFESCLPVEVMIARGVDTLRFGPCKPVGFTDPRTQKRPYAVIQLRRENKNTSMWNMVGFQSRMKWGDQARVFRKIPALKEAEFLRFASIHRNTYVHGPEVLGEGLILKKQPRFRLAGQITGVEGYTESAAMGLIAARALTAQRRDVKFEPPPANSIMGALYRHVTMQRDVKSYQPMNANLGLLPSIPKTKGIGKKERHKIQCDLATAEFGSYVHHHMEVRL